MLANLKVLRTLGVALAIIGALLVVLDVAESSRGRGQVEVLSELATPLFQRRFQENAARFETGPAVPEHAQGDGRSRHTTATPTLALVWPSEAFSACVASACASSSCGGSACGASVCAGSACAGSVCAGSGCAGSCNRPLAPGSILSLINGGWSCPIDADRGVENLRITGFELTPTADGTEVRFVASGAEVLGYRLYRQSPQERAFAVASGPAFGDEMIRVVDPARGDLTDMSYAIEIVDGHGRVTRVTTPRNRQPTMEGLAAQTIGWNGDDA